MNIAKHALDDLSNPEFASFPDRHDSTDTYPHLTGRLAEIRKKDTIQSPAEVLVDAASVNVSLCDGILRIVPARHVTCLSLSLEQCSDGAILISDEVGYAGTGSLPEIRGEIRAIHIALGIDGDDTLHIDLHPASVISKNVHIFSAFGDDVTSSYGPIVVRKAP